MKKLLIAALAALGVAAPVAAERLDADRALERALKSSGPMRARAMSPSSMKLAYEASGSEFYVFDRADKSGFIIASGDDRMRPLLGVGNGAAFDSDNMPEAMRAWLDFYRAELNSLAPAAEASTTDGVFENYAKWTAIEPIVKTQWNQTAPYNNLCPQAGGRTCPTGCVATAMAQLVNALGYYNGQGSNTYTPAAVGSPVTFDFAAWKPDFSKMVANYENYGTQKPTDEQINEVATLMKACGVAVNMGYSANSSGAGAPINGLVKYFGYDASSTIINRADMSTAQWEALVYGQLSLGRPLYYAGTGDGAHAFVCDGYSSDGLFHFNWGWGGISDGYFALSALQPAAQGVGSFAGGYNVGQQIGIFVVPGAEKPAPVVGSKPLNMVYQQSVSATVGSGTKDQINVFHTSFSGSGQVGRSLLLVAADGSEIFVKPEGYSQINYMQGGLMNYSVDFASTELPAGKYHAYPAFCVKDVDGYWPMQHVSQYPPLNRDDHLLLTVAPDGKRSYAKADVVNPGIEAFDMYTNDLYAGDWENRLCFTLSNSSSQDWIEKISMRLLDSKGNVVSTLATTYPFLAAGASKQMDMRLDVKQAGTYTVRMYRDGYGDLPFGENSLQIVVKSGQRPYDGNKGIEPSGLCTIALWDEKTSTDRNLEDMMVVPGQTISGTTALLANSEHPFTYDIAVCEHGNNYKVLWRKNLATNITSSTTAWQRGHDFEIAPDVAPGTYSLLFVDPYDVAMSYPADFIVCIEQDGMRFRINDDAKSVTLCGLSAPLAGAVEVPATVKYDGKEYDVTAIDSRAAVNCYDMTELIVPATVGSIGLDAFRGCTGLKTVRLRGAEVPFSSSVLPFYGMKPGAEFYVSGEAYDAYAKAFHSRGALYGELTRLDVEAEATVKTGDEVALPLDVNTPHFNPALIEVESSDASVVTAQLCDASLLLRGLKAGTATVSVGCKELGVDKTVTVTVSEQNAIVEISASGESSAAAYDLQGRRVVAPKGGFYIVNGRKIFVR